MDCSSQLKGNHNPILPGGLPRRPENGGWSGQGSHILGTQYLNEGVDELTGTLNGIVLVEGESLEVADSDRRPRNMRSSR